MTFVSCSLQQCIFNCCVTTAFFCNHIVCNHSVYWIWGDGELNIQAGFEPACMFNYLELLIETWLAKTQNLKHTSLALCPFTIQNYKILLYQGCTNPGCLVYQILFGAAWYFHHIHWSFILTFKTVLLHMHQAEAARWWWASQVPYRTMSLHYRTCFMLCFRGGIKPLHFVKICGPLLYVLFSSIYIHMVWEFIKTELKLLYSQDHKQCSPGIKIYIKTA